MDYDFETLINREKFSSIKWNHMRELNPKLKGDDVPLSLADMEFKNAPEIVEGLREYIGKAIYGYTAPPPSYKNSVMNWMERRHNWQADPEWIVNTPGVVTALAESILSTTEEGEGVIIFSPVYHPFAKMIKQNNRKIADCPLIEKDNHYSIDFELFKKLAALPENKLLMFCSPHNPVGRVWRKEELQKVSDICLENELYIVSDEIHNDIIMPGFKHTVMDKINPDLRKRLVLCTAPTKTFNLAGLQISNIFIPDEELREKFKNNLSKMALGNTNMIAYKACELAYNFAEKWLDEAIIVIDRNQKLVKEFFEKNFPAVKAPLIEGTYLQWLDFRKLGLNYQTLENFLYEKAGFFTDQGYIFGDNGKGFERVNLALPEKFLQIQLNKLLVALKRLYDE